MPDIFQFWDTAALFSPVKVHQQLGKFATKLPKCAQILRSLCKKRAPAWKKKKDNIAGCGSCDKYQLCMLSRIRLWPTLICLFFSPGIIAIIGCLSTYLYWLKMEQIGITVIGPLDWSKKKLCRFFTTTIQFRDSKGEGACRLTFNLV